MYFSERCRLNPTLSNHIEHIQRTQKHAQVNNKKVYYNTPEQSHYTPLVCLFMLYICVVYLCMCIILVSGYTYCELNSIYSTVSLVPSISTMDVYRGIT